MDPGTFWTTENIENLEKTQIDFQQRYRVILVTTNNIMIESICVLDQFGILKLESRFFYQISQIIVN